MSHGRGSRHRADGERATRCPVGALPDRDRLVGRPLLRLRRARAHHRRGHRVVAGPPDRAVLGRTGCLRRRGDLCRPDHPSPRPTLGHDDRLSARRRGAGRHRDSVDPAGLRGGLAPRGRRHGRRAVCAGVRRDHRLVRAGSRPRTDRRHVGRRVGVHGLRAARRGVGPAPVLARHLPRARGCPGGLDDRAARDLPASGVALARGGRTRRA